MPNKSMLKRWRATASDTISSMLRMLETGWALSTAHTALRTELARLIGSTDVRTTSALARSNFICRKLQYICILGWAVKSFCRTSFTTRSEEHTSELQSRVYTSYAVI